MTFVTDLTLDNLEQVLQSSASLYTTVVPWFGKEYEQPVSICIDDVSGQVYYRFPNGWAWYPIERKKNYIFISMAKSCILIEKIPIYIKKYK